MLVTVRIVLTPPSQVRENESASEGEKLSENEVVGQMS